MMNPMRILVRLVLIWKFREIISRCCATLSAIGCTEYMQHTVWSIYMQHTVKDIYMLHTVKTYTRYTLSKTCTCYTLSKTCTYYIYMQYAVWYIYMQDTRPRFDRRHVRTSTMRSLEESTARRFVVLHTATHGNILQHTATSCNRAWRGAIWDTRHGTASHCNTLQHIATRFDRWQTHISTAGFLIESTARRYLGYESLQHTAKHCNSLHHTATQFTSTSRSLEESTARRWW